MGAVDCGLFQNGSQIKLHQQGFVTVYDQKLLMKNERYIFNKLKI